MSCVSFISFPREQNIYDSKSDSENELNGDSIVLEDKGDSTFIDCFINSFVYDYNIVLLNDYFKSDEYMAIIRQEVELSTAQKWLKDNENRRIAAYQQGLFNCLYRNLDVGEFAEIYKGWTDHVSTVYDPPETEQVINLSDLLTTPLLQRANVISPHKLTIHKDTNEYGVYRLQGSTHDDQHDVENYYRRQLVQLQAQGDKHNVALVCIEIGNIVGRYWDASSAEALYKQALDIWIEQGDNKQAFHVCNLIASLSHTYDREKNWEQKIGKKEHILEETYWYEQALKYAIESGDDNDIVDAYHSLAHQATCRKDYIAADELYKKALNYSTKINDEDAITGIYFNMAYAASLSGDFDLTEEYYKKVLSYDLSKGENYSHQAMFIKQLMDEIVAKKQD